MVLTNRSPARLAASSLLLLVAVGLPAQESVRPGVRNPLPAPQDVPVKIPTDDEGSEALELTLLDAMRIGRVQNLGLRAEELGPLQATEGVRIADAFFEPELFGTVNSNRTERAPANAFQPGSVRETIDGSVGLRQRIPTGALYELTFTPLRLKQSVQSTFQFPTSQWTMDFTARVTQPLLRGAWADAALADVRAAGADLEGSRSRFERTVQDTLIEVVSAYWELVFAREDYRVKAQSLALASEQLRITNERIRVRELAERDRVFDEADVARRREELIRAENEIRRREDELRQLLFDDSDGLIWDRGLRPVSPFEGEFAVPEDDWRDLSRIALDRRPDLAALRAAVETAEVRYREAERNVLPQLDLVASYGTDSIQENSRDAWRDLTNLEYPDWGLGLQLSIPIGNNAARGARDRAMLVLEQARRRLYAAELDVSREVRAALRNLVTLAESIRASRESVRLSETQLDTERERLRVGRGTIFEVQQRNQELLEARQRLLRNQLDYRISESRLDYVQGDLSVGPAVPEPADAR
ncbi:MAG: TolC family protein [Planctomycetota bacterium]